MTRKHFVQVAAEIKAAYQLSTNDDAKKAVERIAHGMATVFKQLNSGFDKTRFLTACGVPQ